MPLLIGLAIGIVMCIPIGPINVWVINTQIKRGRKAAMSIALGGCAMDFLYFVALSSGVSLLPIDHSTALLLKSFGVIVLLIMGLKELVWAKIPAFAGQAEMTPEWKAPSKISSFSPLMKFFLFGVFIYISNPTLVATLTGLTAMIRSWNLFIPNITNHLWLGLGAGIGSAIWFYMLSGLVKKYQNKVQGKIMLWATRVCGLLIIILAIVMGVKLIDQIRSYKKLTQVEIEQSEQRDLATSIFQ